MSNIQILSSLGLSPEMQKVAENLSEAFKNLTKDLPEATKSTLATVIVGGALVAAGVALAKK